MKYKFLVSLSVALLVTISQVSADDIDIYVDPAATSGSEPVVMFTLDYRSNLGSAISSCGFLEGLTYKNASDVDQYYLKNNQCATFFDLLRGAMKYLFQQVGPSGVRIGLAISHEQNSNCDGPGKTGCSNGGYIIIGGNPLTSQAQRDAFYAKLDAMPTPGGTVNHPYQGKELFFELFRYFSSQGWHNMKNGWVDRGTSNTYNLNQADDYSPSNPSVPLSWDTSIVSGANYISPIGSSCNKLYTVNILFQVSQQENDSDSAIRAAAGSGGMGGINLAGSNNSFSTVIRWMYDNDNNAIVSGKQGVISYFVVDPSKVNTTTRAYASAGVGLSAGVEPYVLSNDPQELVNTLSQIFINILSTSTTFVAPAVTVNVYNRASVINEVYLAMFQAQEDGLPVWPGNLKKYELRYQADGTPQLWDYTPQYAVAADGRVDFDALSYWTIVNDLPDPPTAVATTLVTGRDGRAVDRGGAGSKIPGFKLKCATGTDTACYPGDYSPGLTNLGAGVNTSNTSNRKVFTEPATYTAGTPSTLLNLDADVATATALQSDFAATSVGTCDSTDTDPYSACNLIIYARGAAYVDHDNDTSTADVLRARSWIMSDVLHSQPFAINYGARSGSSYTASNPDIRIVAGSNDGLVHMFRNTREGVAPAPNADTHDGVETWAFMPREVMSTIPTLKANSVTAPPHPYTTDGTPSVYTLDWNGNGNIETPDADGKYDKVYLYFGLRRGGTAYYALDVTNPDDPKMLWKIKRGDTGFEELGQTWSTPNAAMMLYDGSTTSRPVLIFGGGYDPNKDTHPGHESSDGTKYTGTELGTDDTQGNAIFIVNAETGALIWKAVKGTSTGYDALTKSYTHPGLLDSIPSAVKVVDAGGNGLADRLYVGDTGGVVWRADLTCRNQDGSGTKTDGTTPLCPEGGWKITPMVSVGRHSVITPTIADDRRFFYPPEYVQTTDGSGSFDAIVFGTGDRENPKDTTVTNWYYMFKDRNTVSGTLSSYSGVKTHSQFGDVSSNCLQDNPDASCVPDLTYGWRMKLECMTLTSPTVCGEKNLAETAVIGGKIFFTTYIPALAASNIGSCDLAEGSGVEYRLALQDGSAVDDLEGSNNTASKTLFKRDRARALQASGIPPRVVSLGVTSPGKVGTLTGSQGGATAAKPGYKTFWYEKYRK